MHDFTVRIFSRAREGVSRLPYAWRTLRLIHDAAGYIPYVWMGLLVVQGLVPVCIVYTTKLLVDGIADAVGGGLDASNIAHVSLPAAAMSGLLLIQQLLANALQYLNALQTELVTDHIKLLIHGKAAAVDYVFYESPAYHDRLEQANAQSGARSLAMLQNIGGLLQSSVTFVSIAALLVTYSVLLPILLFLSALPAFVVLLRYNEKHHAWWHKRTPERRWISYYDHCLTGLPAAGELRIYGLGDFFRNQYRLLRKRLRGEQLALLRWQMRAGLFARALALVVTAVAVIWIVRRALIGEAQLGDLALFYQAFTQAQGLMRTFLGNVGQVFANILFLEHLFAFLDQEVLVSDPDIPTPFPEPIRHGIEFRNVSFRYPEAKEFALQNFSLKIPAGQTVALVGANGAGKSTLIKLLCRFYDPQEGAIYIDGIDITRFSLKDLRRHLAVMLQLPMRYHATVYGNIAVGEAQEILPQDHIIKASRAAGAHDFVSRLPMGYDTSLGRLFKSSVDLSGGEWQRLALARAYLRQTPIVALDEPTSSIDSWTENEWFARFREIVQDKTAIIITHRFTTAKQADIIYVMDQGKVIEYGSHDELVAMDGKYADSWKAQVSSSNSRFGYKDLETHGLEIDDSSDVGGGAAFPYGY